MAEMDVSAAGERKVGAALGIGILILPFVFAWFTLRKGYGKLARVVSLVWMGLILLLILASSHNKSEQPTVLEGDPPVDEAPSGAVISEGENAAANAENPAEPTTADLAKRLDRISTCVYAAEIIQRLPAFPEVTIDERLQAALDRAPIVIQQNDINSADGKALTAEIKSNPDHVDIVNQAFSRTNDFKASLSRGTEEQRLQIYYKMADIISNECGI